MLVHLALVNPQMIVNKILVVSKSSSFLPLSFSPLCLHRGMSPSSLLLLSQIPSHLSVYRDEWPLPLWLDRDEWPLSLWEQGYKFLPSNCVHFVHYSIHQTILEGGTSFTTCLGIGQLKTHSHFRDGVCTHCADI